MPVRAGPRARPGAGAGAAVRPSSSASTHAIASTSSTTARQESQPDNNEPVTRNNRHRRRRKQDNWVSANRSGNILYRPETPAERASASSSTSAFVPSFPEPRIGPRRPRPHSINIVTFPPGYVPREHRVRASPIRIAANSTRAKRRGLALLARSTKSDLPLRFLLTRLLSSPLAAESLSAIDLARPPSYSTAALQSLVLAHENPSCPTIAVTSAQRRRTQHQRQPSSHSPRESQHSDHSDHQQHKSHHHSRDKQNQERDKTREWDSREGEKTRSRVKERDQRDSDRAKDTERDKDRQRQRHRSRDAHRSNGRSSGEHHRHHHSHHQQQHQHRHRDPQNHHPDANAMTTSGRMSSTYPVGSPRHSLSSLRAGKSAISHVTEVPKAVATGSGLVCSILLAERQLFLSGFDHDGHGRPEGQTGTALLRGKLQLTISKNVKIKTIQLMLVGKARTEWPEGIPPLKQDTFEEEGLRTQVLTFFSALTDEWETEFGNQCTFRHTESSAESSSTNLSGRRHSKSSSLHGSSFTAKELKHLSLQNVRSRSFGKADSGEGTSLISKGYKVFRPGTYDYTFELPIDHHQLETTKVPYGSVKWELHATVDRAGAFKPNLHGMKELPIIRLPDQLSLEMSEPISISRNWEDQLHYDIMVSGKSFPLGSKIPIAFKLTPLAKVRVHKIKVYITELIEYWTNDKRVTRKDPGRKVLLLEKIAGKALDPHWGSSEINTIRGGELTQDQRREARDQAMRRRDRDARRNGHASDPTPLPLPPDNLLGDLELGLESMWGSTELEANVQIPTCEMMAKDKELRLHADCSWRNVNVFHWIKVVMRISRPDADDPSGVRRRHFEISIDSPLTILDCRATQANTFLPAYHNPVSGPGPYQSACGCPDSATVTMEISPNSSTGELSLSNLLPMTGSQPSSSNPSNASSHWEGVPAIPEPVHLHDPMMTPAIMERLGTCHDSTTAHALIPRPMHLLRAPSFNPPAFDADVAPPMVSEMVPPIMTPPPQYDAVVGTPSVDGLADYFSRLANYRFGHEDDSGSDDNETMGRLTERSGRVNVPHPRTPGGHRFPSRSLELSRPATDHNLGGLHIARGIVSRAAAFREGS